MFSVFLSLEYVRGECDILRKFECKLCELFNEISAHHVLVTLEVFLVFIYGLQPRVGVCKFCVPVLLVKRMDYVRQDYI